MSLPIRPAAGCALPGLPPELAEDPGAGDGLPWLRGTLANPLSQAITLRLRVHNSAGIPILEGCGSLAAGHTELVVSDLRPLGSEPLRPALARAIAEQLGPLLLLADERALPPKLGAGS